MAKWWGYVRVHSDCEQYGSVRSEASKKTRPSFVGSVIHWNHSHQPRSSHFICHCTTRCLWFFVTTVDIRKLLFSYLKNILVVNIFRLKTLNVFVYYWHLFISFQQVLTVHDWGTFENYCLKPRVPDNWRRITELTQRRFGTHTRRSVCGRLRWVGVAVYVTLNVTRAEPSGRQSGNQSNLSKAKTSCLALAELF